MTMGRSEYDQTDTGAYSYADRLVPGADVYGSDDEKIGTVADVGQNYFLVQKGWLFIKDLYLPMSTITRADGNNIFLNLTKHEAEQTGRDELPAEGDTWYGAQRTGYAGTDTAMSDRATTATTGYGTDREVGRTANTREGENVSVPIVEEQLKAGVRETEAGRARVVKDVREEQQTIDVPVQREEVYVTERAANRPATEADMQALDRDIEVPIRQQEVVTQKEAMVTGEVNVRKEVKQDTERVTDAVRREDVHVEGTGSDRVHAEGVGMTGGAGRTVTDQRDYDARGNLVDERTSEQPNHAAGYGTNTTDTAYDRSGMPGDRMAGSRDEGIIDRAKDSLRDGEDRTRNG